VNENLDVSNAQAVDEPFVDESDLNQRVPTKSKGKRTIIYKKLRNIL